MAATQSESVRQPITSDEGARCAYVASSRREHIHQRSGKSAAAPQTDRESASSTQTHASSQSHGSDHIRGPADSHGPGPVGPHSQMVATWSVATLETEPDALSRRNLWLCNFLSSASLVPKPQDHIMCSAGCRNPGQLQNKPA